MEREAAKQREAERKAREEEALRIVAEEKKRVR